MPILCQHEGMAAPTRARAGSQLGTDPPPLFDFSVRTYVHTVGINHGQSGNMETAAVRLYFLLKHYYSLVILYYKIKDEAEREHYTVVHRLYRGIIQLYLNAQDTTDLLLA